LPGLSSPPVRPPEKTDKSSDKPVHCIVSAGKGTKKIKNIEPIGYVFIRLFSIKTTRVNQITGFPIPK
jgi:hypothetical protein